MADAYVNGRIYTMKEEGDIVSAFVVEDGKFIYCGTDEEARRLCGDGTVTDLQGRTVLPGMIDTHQHLFAYGRDLLKLDLYYIEHFSLLNDFKLALQSAAKHTIFT